MTDARLYFESHITCDMPEDPSDSAWATFKQISPFWKCSKFDQDDVDGYHDKWFMSSRHTNFEKLKARIKDQINILSLSGFKVIRWKIEDTLLDSKCGDSL